LEKVETLAAILIYTTKEDHLMKQQIILMKRSNLSIEERLSHLKEDYPRRSPHTSSSST